jgi:hypothetical protein
LPAELAAGEAATALVEVWFQPTDVDDVGQAVLTWHDPAGRPQRLTQRISRLQFAPTFAEAAVSLQQAALAAEVGQELRGNSAALRELGLAPASPGGYSAVLSAARQVHPQLASRSDFQRLLTVVRALAGPGRK